MSQHTAPYIGTAKGDGVYRRVNLEAGMKRKSGAPSPAVEKTLMKKRNKFGLSKSTIALEAGPKVKYPKSKLSYISTFATPSDAIIPGASVMSIPFNATSGEYGTDGRLKKPEINLVPKKTDIPQIGGGKKRKRRTKRK